MDDEELKPNIIFKVVGVILLLLVLLYFVPTDTTTTNTTTWKNYSDANDVNIEYKDIYVKYTMDNYTQIDGRWVNPYVDITSGDCEGEPPFNMLCRQKVIINETS